ncbi:MAG: carbamoyl-phosphate synthase large subunit [Symbiobacteriaceae bacterium]|nr:carbamoyl-phosphate synthase large subunit [Symbiobacteriaceae bacterium]
MPQDLRLKKVLVIGSGPIVIGQAAEFDYAGTQACRVLQEQGVEVVLVNSNPATIMTDPEVAHRTYLEPLSPELIRQIIAKERPQGLLATLGGQIGLNMALLLGNDGTLESYGVELLGTPLEAIRRSEDRQLFKECMQQVGQPVLESYTVQTLEEAFPLAELLGYPLIIRPAFTLGGTGGGFCYSAQELKEMLPIGLAASPIQQCLLERSLQGWKEIEYEAVRDKNDTCLTICSMENVDPLGIHTGDSIVVAPTQTLDHQDATMLRHAAIAIIQALGIEGGCNVQFALNPQSREYYVIEVNPRVSRSSALASKATGYPIARVVSLIALGFTLDEITNPITGHTTACFEPAIDYIVCKVPRWPFDKFRIANRKLSTQMKSTGEVMAIGRSFPEALQKAVRSLEQGYEALYSQDIAAYSTEELQEGISEGNDLRLFLMMEALRRGVTLAEIGEASQIDPFFIQEINRICLMEQIIQQQPLTRDLLWEAKRLGFADSEIARLTGSSKEQVRQTREGWGLKRVYKMVDTCAGLYPSEAPYYYSTFEEYDELVPLGNQTVVVIGSGPIRIGQGVEFDYCSVHAAQALQEAGYQAVMINNNPETVSTDFNVSDRLFFEPLQEEEVLDILWREQPVGVLVQFGGQTAINLASAIHEAGFTILGSSLDTIDLAEDRARFEAMLEELALARPPARGVRSLAEAYQAVEVIGYPVLVRPSYVLGGRGMEICRSPEELEGFLEEAAKITPNHPVLIDRYIPGKELEVDAIADGEHVVVVGIMEHIERAGVHSGDSLAVYPWSDLEPWLIEEVVEATKKLSLALQVKGLINIQFVAHEEKLYILEVNPRSSRTVPFLSKVSGLPMVRVATKVALGQSLRQQGITRDLWHKNGFSAVKAPVFSWSKLRGVEIGLGPEMKSTGEVIGMGISREEALARAFWASGWKPGKNKALLATIANRDRKEAIPLIKLLWREGYEIYATPGTAVDLEAVGVEVTLVHKMNLGTPSVLDVISSGLVDLVINTVSKGRDPQRDGFIIRRCAVEHDVRYFTSLDTVTCFWRCLSFFQSTEFIPPISLQERLNWI